MVIRHDNVVTRDWAGNAKGSADRRAQTLSLQVGLHDLQKGGVFCAGEHLDVANGFVFSLLPAKSSVGSTNIAQQAREGVGVAHIWIARLNHDSTFLPRDGWRFQANVPYRVYCTMGKPRQGLIWRPDNAVDISPPACTGGGMHIYSA